MDRVPVHDTRTHARTDRIFPVLLATVGLAQARPNYYALTRCQCGNCEMMPTPTYQEIAATADKIGTSESSAIHCITDHEGFDAVCLNVWVLPTDNTMVHVM